MPDNAADRKSIRRKEKQSAVDDAQRADVIRSIMSTTDGRAFIWHLLSGCQVFSSTFTGDALSSAFNEGRRAVGLSVIDLILRTCPDQYIQAQRESNVRDTLSERRSGPVDNGRDSGRASGADEGVNDGNYLYNGDGPDYENDIERFRYKTDN